MATQQLTINHFKLERMDEQITNKISDVRKSLKETDDKLLKLNLGEMEEGDIDLVEMKENMKNLERTIKSTLKPFGKKAEFHLRKIINHQVDSTGSSVDIESNDKGLRIFDMTTGTQVDISTLSDGSVNFELPERIVIEQKLWTFTTVTPSGQNVAGQYIFSDSSDAELAALVGSQIAPVLSDSPPQGCELINANMTRQEFIDMIRDASQHQNIEMLRKMEDSRFTVMEHFGLCPRELRDIDVVNDLTIASLNLDAQILADLDNAAKASPLDEAALSSAASAAGLWSTSLGPVPNPKYSDFKRFFFTDGKELTVSLPLIAYDTDMKGICMRDLNGNLDVNNRKTDGKSYLIDMGGIVPACRLGKPNPLPAHRYNNNGPDFASVNQGALKRYKGGKCLGINTSNSKVDLVTKWFNGDPAEVGGVGAPKAHPIPAKTALWKLDNGSFTFNVSGKTLQGVDDDKRGGQAGFYTVFAASRPPASGFMGVSLATKHHKFGKGADVIASGQTLANGLSATGKVFKLQDANGNALKSDGTLAASEDDADAAGLKGLTGANDGHGMDLPVLLAELNNRNAVRGVDYLTIPANADASNVEDILIPAGKVVPRITQAVARLTQFANGIFIEDGGPNSFQPGLVPFMGGVPGYTPNWHINWAFFNCGRDDSNSANVPDSVQTTAFDDWVFSGRNPSNGPPGPVPIADGTHPTHADIVKSVGFTQSDPGTLDPVQMSNNIKGNHCPEYVSGSFPNSVNFRIPIDDLPTTTEVLANNKLYVTEAPGGARQGWVKFLIVNCPLPVQINFETEFKDDESLRTLLNSE